MEMTIGDPLHSAWMARASSGRNSTGTLTKEEKSSIDSSSLKPPLTSSFKVNVIFISGQRSAPADQWLVWAQFEEKGQVGCRKLL